MAESPDVVIGMRLLNTAKRHGFQFRRGPPARTGRCGACGRRQRCVFVHLSAATVLREHCPNLVRIDLVDTVKLARNLYPGLLGGHGLDNLIRHLGIPASWSRL